MIHKLLPHRQKVIFASFSSKSNPHVFTRDTKQTMKIFQELKVQRTVRVSDDLIIPVVNVIPKKRLLKYLSQVNF